MPSSCTCKKHNDITLGKSSNVLNIVTSKKFKRNPLFNMQLFLVISLLGLNTCVSCATTTLKIKHCIDVALALGTSINQNIMDDCESISSQYRDPVLMANYCADDWSDKRNKVLVSFLKEATDTTESQNAKKKRRLSSSVECVYDTRNTKLITPTFFGMNLLIYHKTASKGSVHTRNDRIAHYLIFSPTY